jgi:hypothetical protein
VGKSRTGPAFDVAPVRIAAPAMAPIADVRIASAAPAFAAASSVFEQLARQLGQTADAEAQARGTREGLSAGAKEDFKPTGELTIAGQARDRAAIATYQAKLEAGVRADYEGLYETHKDNPARLKASMDALAKGYRARLFPEVESDFEVLRQRLSSGYMLEAGRRREANDRDAAAAAQVLFVDTRTRGIETDARTYGFTPEGIKRAALQANEFEQDLIDLHGPKGPFTDHHGKSWPADPRRSGAMSLERIAKVSLDARDRALSAAVEGDFERQPTVAARAQFVEKFIAARGKTALDPDKFDALAARMAASVLREQNGAERAKAEIGREAEALKTEIDAGRAPSPERITALKEQARVLGDDGAAADEVERYRQFHHAWAVAPDTVLTGKIQDLSAKAAKSGLSTGEAATLKSLTRLRTNRESAKRSNPVEHAMGLGLVTPGQIDLRAPDAAQKLKRRAAELATPAAQGVIGPRAPVLTKSESEGLSAALDDPATSPAERTGVLQRIMQAGGQIGQSVLRELGVKDGATAWAAGMASDRPAAAQSILAGRDAVKARPDLRPTQTELADTSLSIALNVMFADRPRDGAAYRDAVINAYVDAAAKRGVKDFDAGLFDATARRMLGEMDGPDGPTGGTETYNGRLTAVPPDVTKTQFRARLNAMTDAELAAGSQTGQPPLLANGKPFTARLLREQGLLIPAGKDRYFIADGLGPDGRPRVAKTADGRNFIFVWRKPAAAPAAAKPTPQELMRQNAIPDPAAPPPARK